MLATFINGIITVLVSVFLCLRFYLASRLIKHPFFRLFAIALSFQMAGEAVIATGTLTFSYGAWTGDLEHWSDFFQSILRNSMFACTCASSIFLAYTVETKLPQASGS